MFTGIVETTSKTLNVVKGTHTKIIIEKPDFFDDVVLGTSIAVNGVCLTVVEHNASSLTFVVSPETQKLTALNFLKKGDHVNLERSLPAHGRMGGHYVQGHIDGMGKISSIHPEGEGAWRLTLNILSSFSKYIAKKGFIAIDGMSLTVVESKKDWLSVMLIPYTIHHTIARYYTTINSSNMPHNIYNHVNIELDILAKYTEKLLLHDKT